MENLLDGSAAGGSSMTESSGSTDLTEIPETGEVSESTSLSPLANSFEHHLGIQEDSGGPSADVKMGIENTWTEPNCSASDVVSVAIPMPPPQPYDDFVIVGADTAGETAGPQHGPFLPPASLNNLFADTADIPEDTAVEASSPAGVCGLRNLGNTCFMSAGLQCLTATPTVMHHFLQQQQQGDEKSPTPGSLMEHFSSLITKMWSGRYTVVKPTEFKQTLGAYHSQFKDYRQHDCQEFLALLLDSLHEQMNTAKSAKYNNRPLRSPPMLRPITASSHHQDDLMECLDSPTSCPNSPNATMAGSPRELDSSMDGLDSTANSPSCSPFREDDDTLDSEEVLDTKSSFIFNKTSGESVYGEMETLSKKSNPYKFYDIIKDAKTSNANFLVTSQEYNNEIHFDSQKFPKDNARRMALDSSNLTENHDFDNKNLSVKRIKEVNVQKVNGEGLGGDEADCHSGIDKCNVKRMRLEEQEKNHRGVGTSSRSLCVSEGAVAAGEEVEADKHWARHLQTNKSIIVDSFQGQFKSTVVCAVCKHVSVTYEPFMYLSVPLPNAMERQLAVTYIPANDEQPIRCVVSLNKQARIGKLKEELLNTLERQDVDVANVALAEVLENHISRILDDNLLLKYVKDTSRTIYAFELTDPPDACGSSQESLLDHSPSSSMEMNNNNVISSNSEEEISQCTICLEEVEGDLKRHEGNDCTFIMCQACIENYFKNQKEPRACPVCQSSVEPSSFIKIDQTGRPRPAVRILNVPVIMRYDTISDEAPNNQKKTELFSYPHLVRLPSRVSARSLYDVVERVVPQGEEYTLHFVDGTGYHCSRCMYNAHCTGCPVPESGMVSLQSSDTLAVRYTNNIPKMPQPRDHVSVSKQRPPHPLSLYDCLQAFTQSESLDEHNPWYCPKCERNQCATKTLTVHRYPKYLIVYLKRFVFYECVSMKLDDKVTFPLVGLSVGRHLYDLYACVCHFGGVSAGHYTAYAKNPHTDTWHYYNDEITSKQKPQEEDYSNAYILFYSRQGTNSKQCNI